MTKRLIVAGFGGFGRETLAWARAVEAGQSEWRIAGVLDPDPRVVAERGYDVPYLGDPLAYAPLERDLFVVASGDPRLRREVADALGSRQGRLTSLVHPSVIIGHNVRLGEGAVLCPGAILTCDVAIGRLFLCTLAATVGHDVVMGDCCTLFCHADITGHVVLGDDVTVGSHGVVLPWTKVGDGATIGAGSVAVGAVPPGITVFGVPARKLH